MRIPEGVKVTRDIDYGQKGNKAQTLDVYCPQNAKGPLPLIVWIHGGAWTSGSKEYCPAVPYSAQGYAVASINYRLSGEAIFPHRSRTAKAPSAG
jgi:acetyl esterase/lipase